MTAGRILDLLVLVVLVVGFSALAVLATAIVLLRLLVLDG